MSWDRLVARARENLKPVEPVEARPRPTDERLIELTRLVKRRQIELLDANGAVYPPAPATETLRGPDGTG